MKFIVTLSGTISSFHKKLKQAEDGEQEEMIKKIIAIAIISMFLLTGFTTVSAVEIKADVPEPALASSDDEPDFIVSGVHYSFVPGPCDIRVKIVLSNIGNPTDITVVPIKFWLEGFEDSAVENTVDLGQWTTPNKWAGIWGIDKPDSKLIYTLIVEIDPDNEIPELDDENNIGSKNIIFPPKARNIHSFDFFARFPIFARLLQFLQ